MQGWIDFSEWFRALWGYGPFPWQAMLAERLADGTWPKTLDLPTAAGKTACIDIALYALAAQAERPLEQRTAPRRIWFVVDRRIIVDAAFERAQAIASRLQNAHDGPIKAVADRLFAIGGTKHRPLATARLRGGMLRDDGWARLPSQPAVITSTVDQLGSRLLFRGYGRSARTASIFAGLAAHDSLIVLDEAHLSLPFLDTLDAVARYRGADWAYAPLHTPFAFTMLSATPPESVPDELRFPGQLRAQALAHPELERRMRAAKPAELVKVKDKIASGDPLITEAAKRAHAAAIKGGYQRVAVVVNRVATAQATAAAVREIVGDAAYVVLLTGRLRALDRDRLLARWQPMLEANDPQPLDKPIVVVATQTIEVGADFSFDALITEAASLDALRQRFGRLNRLGRADSAPGTILIRGADAKPASNDPIYGMAMAECWRLLHEVAITEGEGKHARTLVDFGNTALDATLSEVDDLAPYLAPTSRAPVLLPAHLDLLCQTAPESAVQPDIALYLHGTQRGSPEARVIWRADLTPGHADSWIETVALCPPNSLETLSVPLHRLRQWLADSDASDDTADVEGSASPEDNKPDKRSRPVLIWRGRERSQITVEPGELRPNDLVILPVQYGMSGLGQAPDDPRDADIWEASHVQIGRRPTLRLQRNVLAPWLVCPPLRALVEAAESPDVDAQTLRELTELVIDYAPSDADDPPAPPEWCIDLLRRCQDGRTENHPASGLILIGPAPRRGTAEEQDVFADDDDMLSAAGRDVSLAAHSAAVESAIRRLCGHCLPEKFRDILAAAGHWHDAGKLDERFQILLRQGNELAAVSGEPLAKSNDIPSSPRRRRLIRQASGLPEGFRHEMLSLQLAERFGCGSKDNQSADLFLHTVASHHGHARPFAPVVTDSQPPRLGGTRGDAAIEVDSETRTHWPAAHHLQSGIPQRFWRLTRRYGWWGLAYLEAIVRLGDWYGSQWASVDEPFEKAAHSPTRPGVISRPNRQEIILAGIDGTNPLGFLAAIGVLVVLHEQGHQETELAWRRGLTWQPVLNGHEADSPDSLVWTLSEGLGGQSVSSEAEQRRAETAKRIDAARTEVKNKRNDIKKRRLRGDEKKAVEREELSPLVEKAARLEADWRDALREAVPRPELALGKHIDCTATDYRDHATRMLESATATKRESLDLLAAFASDACLHDNDNKRKQGIVAPTPFCFITGSGHQYFLDFARQLLDKVEPDRLRSTLFDPWRYTDPGLSMRWDPTDARRYALMDRDPTASDNKASTDWMANLLAYRALALFASAPRQSGLATTGWSLHGREPRFSWPLWTAPCDPDTLRSLLLLPELYAEKPDRAALRERGMPAVFRARRIKVGPGANFKLNFSPSRAA